MQPAENKDYSRDVILRLSPTRNTIIVEEQKPGGIAAYRGIDPLELYYVINQSYASNDYLDSGFLPEHCLHLSMSATEKYFVLGATNSVYKFSQHIAGDHVVLEFCLSPDYYEPLYFANSLVDLLRYCQCSIRRIEAKLAERETENTRKEAA